MNTRLLRLWWVPLLSLAGTLPLVPIRRLITGKPYYEYLVWNLILACVPYVVAALQTLFAARRRLAGKAGGFATSALFALGVAAWVLFYPNAPYIFTDFIHLVERTWVRAPTQAFGLTAIIWYDIAMNAAFSFAGHLVGLASIWLEARAIERVWGRRPARRVVSLALLASGFGIYVGRFVRLNSWDLFVAPVATTAEILAAFADPKAVLFSLAFSFFVAMSYLVLVAFKRLGEGCDD